MGIWHGFGEAITEELEKLIEQTRNRPFPQEERDAQRRSFVYGNIRIENDRITRKLVAEQDQSFDGKQRSGR